MRQFYHKKLWILFNKVYTIHLSTTFVESFSIWNLVRKEYVNKNKLNNKRYGRTQSSLYPKNVIK